MKIHSNQGATHLFYYDLYFTKKPRVLLRLRVQEDLYAALAGD